MNDFGSWDRLCLLLEALDGADEEAGGLALGHLAAWHARPERYTSRPTEAHVRALEQFLAGPVAAVVPHRILEDLRWGLANSGQGRR